MAAYSYKNFRTVLGQQGFELIRSKKHETWRRVLADGTILRVSISHQGSKDIPQPLFRIMLRQAGLTRGEFAEMLLGGRKR